MIGLPDGSACVCQPRSRAGVIQDPRRPMRNTRHWRLGSMQSRLTMQRRFLVFHGPGQLIAKGCRGVKMESAARGRLINQAATLGFRANLAYANSRCETFVGGHSGGPHWQVCSDRCALHRVIDWVRLDCCTGGRTRPAHLRYLPKVPMADQSALSACLCASSYGVAEAATAIKAAATATADFVIRFIAILQLLKNRSARNAKNGPWVERAPSRSGFTKR